MLRPLTIKSPVMVALSVTFLRDIAFMPLIKSVKLPVIIIPFMPFFRDFLPSHATTATTLNAPVAGSPEWTPIRPSTTTEPSDTSPSSFADTMRFDVSIPGGLEKDCLDAELVLSREAMLDQYVLYRASLTTPSSIRTVLFFGSPSSSKTMLRPLAFTFGSSVSETLFPRSCPSFNEVRPSKRLAPKSRDRENYDITESAAAGVKTTSSGALDSLPESFTNSTFLSRSLLIPSISEITPWEDRYADTGGVFLPPFPWLAVRERSKNEYDSVMSTPSVLI